MHLETVSPIHPPRKYDPVERDKRQRAAIAGFAKGNGYEVVDEYYDAAVSGADLVNQRPGFMEMLRRVTANGAKIELHPDVVAKARRLRRKRPKGGQMSLRAISAELAASGHLNECGRPYNPKSVASMLAR